MSVCGNSAIHDKSPCFDNIAIDNITYLEFFESLNSTSQLNCLLHLNLLKNLKISYK